MADAILVLNAGSSSLKFTGYLVEDQGLAKVVSGKARNSFQVSRRFCPTRPKTRKSHVARSTSGTDP